MRDGHFVTMKGLQYFEGCVLHIVGSWGALDEKAGQGLCDTGVLLR